MFTGIIEAVGRVTAIESLGGSSRLRVEAAPIARDAAIGASVAVNGACLTVTETGAGCLAFEDLLLLGEARTDEHDERIRPVGGFQPTPVRNHR